MCIYPLPIVFKLKVACSLFTWTGSEIHTQLHTICTFKPLLIWNGHIATHEQHSTSKKCCNHLAFNNKNLSAKQAKRQTGISHSLIWSFIMSLVKWGFRRLSSWNSPLFKQLGLPPKDVSASQSLLPFTVSEQNRTHLTPCGYANFPLD